MNSHKLIVSVLLLVCVLLSACQAQAKPVPTANPLGEHVIAEWNKTLPMDIAFGFGSVWIPGHRDPRNTIRIDPNTNQVAATMDSTGSLVNSVLIVGDYVWVDGVTDDMSKIDPKTNTIVANVTGSHTALAYAFGSIWSPTLQGKLDRIDPDTAKISSRLPQ